QRLLIINGIASYLIVDAGQTARLRVAGAESRARLDAFLEGAGDLRSPVGVQAAVGAQGSASAGSGLAPAEISRIVERLQEEGHADWAEQVQQLMRVLPDRIASIESVGESDVYDFEVCDVHLLSGGGIYTSNSRRGALMLILDDWHPDVLEFIEAKRDMGQITNANISVAVSHAFMK